MRTRKPGREGAADERVTRIWRTTANRVRLELVSGEEVIVQVVDGRRWWYERNGEGVTTGEDGRPPFGRSATAEIDSFARHLGRFDLEVLGPARHAERPCVRIRAVPRPTPAWTMQIDRLRGDEHEALIDEDQGLVVRLESRQDAEVVALSEYTELHLDEELDDALLDQPAPGATVHTDAERRRDFFPSLGEAVERAPFTVLVPERLPPDACLTSVHLGRRTDSTHTVLGLVYDLHRGEHLLINEAAVPAALSATTDWARVDHEGLAMWLWGPGESTPGVSRYLRTARYGTEVMVSAPAAMHREMLVDLAASLAPAPGRRKAGPDH